MDNGVASLDGSLSPPTAATPTADPDPSSKRSMRDQTAVALDNRLGVHNPTGSSTAKRGRAPKTTTSTRGKGVARKHSSRQIEPEASLTSVTNASSDSSALLEAVATLTGAVDAVGMVVSDLKDITSDFRDKAATGTNDLSGAAQNLRDAVAIARDVSEDLLASTKQLRGTTEDLQGTAGALRNSASAIQDTSTNLADMHDASGVHPSVPTGTHRTWTGRESPMEDDNQHVPPPRRASSSTQPTLLGRLSEPVAPTRATTQRGRGGRRYPEQFRRNGPSFNRGGGPSYNRGAGPSFNRDAPFMDGGSF